MKDYQVKRMFESIAFSYDFQNSFLSLRRDVYWRKALARSLAAGPSPLILDVATGTCEVAINICRQHPQARVFGVDFSPRMLQYGRRKVRRRQLQDRIRLALADARCLPVGDNSVDAVTMAFGIRNIEERQVVLQEFHRVLKPGGQLLIMEFYLPEDVIFGGLYRLYFDYLLPHLGNWLSRTNYAYSYLTESVYGFPSEASFVGEIAAAGFAGLRVKKLTYGIARIFTATKKN